MKKKTVALLLALVLCAGCAVGGTVAWLTDEATPVTNTFTPSSITIELTETTPDGRTAKMVPGNEIAKNPTVTVKAGSEPCWLFVKVEDNNASTYLNYTVNSAVWYAVTGHDGYWYCEVGTDTALASDEAKNILTGDKVTVKETITSDQMEAISGTNPTITFKAAAVQKANIANVEAAWAALPTAFTNP